MSSLCSYQARQQLRQQTKKSLRALPPEAKNEQRLLLQNALGQELNLRLQQDQEKLDCYLRKIPTEMAAKTPVSRQEIRAARQWLLKTYRTEIDTPAKLWAFGRILGALLAYEIQTYLTEKGQMKLTR